MANWAKIKKSGQNLKIITKNSALSIGNIVVEHLGQTWHLATLNQKFQFNRLLNQRKTKSSSQVK